MSEKDSYWRLSCEGLSKSFDGVVAASKISLDLHGPRITAIIGPNGAGKTTLINMLTGFLKPDEGRYYLDEQDVTGFSPSKMAKLGVIRSFQDLRLIREATIVDNVLLGCRSPRGETVLGALLGAGREEEKTNRLIAERALHIVGLVQKRQELAGTLSYGQQKLLSMACCLAAGGHVLIFDEPVAGVEPTVAEQILDLLSELRSSEQATIVFIEHDIGAVRRVADHVVVMDSGSVVAEGPVDDVMERPEIVDVYLG